MLLQLAENNAPARHVAPIEYISLPLKNFSVRADYYDNLPLKEMAAELVENGYSLAEISELAAKRATRRTAAAPAKQAPRAGIFGGTKKAERREFKAAKREQKILKKAAKTEVKQARAAKKRDTGAARKTRAQAKVYKAQRQEPTEAEELLNTVVNTAGQNFDQEQETFYPDNGGQEFDQEIYYPEAETETETVETEEVTPEEMSEYLSASKKERRKKITTALVKGITTAAKSYTSTGKKPGAPGGTVKLPPPVKTDPWNETLFKLGDTPVTKKAAAVAGTLVIIGGLAISKKNK